MRNNCMNLFIIICLNFTLKLFIYFMKSQAKGVLKSGRHSKIEEEKMSTEVIYVTYRSFTLTK